jgi:hypothetical protein
MLLPRIIASTYIHGQPLLVFSPTSNNAASPHHRKYIYPWSALVGVFTNKNYEKGNTILLLVKTPTSATEMAGDIAEK